MCVSELISKSTFPVTSSTIACGIVAVVFNSWFNQTTLKSKTVPPGGLFDRGYFAHFAPIEFAMTCSPSPGRGRSSWPDLVARPLPPHPRATGQVDHIAEALGQ